jgi:hypothetical protein
MGTLKEHMNASLRMADSHILQICHVLGLVLQDGHAILRAPLLPPIASNKL